MQRLTRWGNSTGLRLPASVMEAAGLEVGDYLYVRLLYTGDIRVRPAKNAQPAHPPTGDKETGAPEAASPVAAKVTMW